MSLPCSILIRKNNTGLSVGSLSGGNQEKVTLDEVLWVIVRFRGWSGNNSEKKTRITDEKERRKTKLLFQGHYMVRILFWSTRTFRSLTRLTEIESLLKSINMNGWMYTFLSRKYKPRIIIILKNLPPQLFFLLKKIVRNSIHTERDWIGNYCTNCSEFENLFWRTTALFFTPTVTAQAIQQQSFWFCRLICSVVNKLNGAPSWL